MAAIKNNDDTIHLEEQEIHELSPVKRPANRRPKLFQKSGDDLMPMTPEQKKILAPYAKAADVSEEDLFKALEKMDEDKREALFKAFKSKSAEAKMAEEGKEEADGKVAEMEKAADANKAKVEKALELVAADKAEDALPLLNEVTGKKEIFKSEDLSPAALKHFEKMEAAAAADRVRIEKAEAELKANKDAESKRVWTEKAADLKALPAAEDVNNGDLLAEVANKAGDELAGKLHSFMKTADAAIREGDLYKEKGDNRDGAPREGSAEANLEKMAKSFQEKSDTPLTYEQAYTKCLRLHPDLARRVQAEQD
jgi:hypothetical protein